MLTAVPTEKPWGIVLTTVFAAVIVANSIFGLFLGAVVGALPALLENQEELLQSIIHDPFKHPVFWLAGAVGLLGYVGATYGMAALFASVKGRPRPRAYLSLHSVTPESIVAWMGVGLFVGAVVQAALAASGINIMRGEVALYTQNVTIPSMILLCIAAVVAAPLAEEVLFRGFVLSGYLGTDPGIFRTLFAVILSSILYGTLNLQYNLVGMGICVLLGALLCIVRIRTKSLYPGMVLHGSLNMTAVIALFFGNMLP